MKCCRSRTSIKDAHGETKEHDLIHKVIKRRSLCFSLHLFTFDGPCIFNEHLTFQLAGILDLDIQVLANYHGAVSTNRLDRVLEWLAEAHQLSFCLVFYLAHKE